MNAMLGKTHRDAFGELLGTGYSQFKSHCGIDGLAKEEGRILHLLAVHASRPGTGQFRKFIKLAKLNYGGIYVWEVWNEVLANALRRYGFTEAEMQDQGQTVKGFGWAMTPIAKP